MSERARARSERIFNGKRIERNMKSLFLLLCASFVMKIPPFIAALSNSYTHTPTEKSFSIDDESDFRVSRRSHEN